MFTLHVNASLPEFRHPSLVTRVPSREDGALFAHFVRSRGLNYNEDTEMSQ